ncbi:hypothetical protein SLA2020_321960 [Shorea laevis]
MEKIHVTVKSLTLLKREEDLEYECLMLLYHFLNATMMLLHKETKVPMFDQGLAKLIMGLTNTSHWTMKMLSWNCRDATKMEFCNRIYDL